MDEIRPSPSPSPLPPTPPTVTVSTSDTSTRRRQGRSVMSRIKKDCLSFAVSLEESFLHVKAMLMGKAKKLMARNEKEATAADLQAAKMQVEATDEAESTKKRLDKTM